MPNALLPARRVAVVILAAGGWNVLLPIKPVAWLAAKRQTAKWAAPAAWLTAGSGSSGHLFIFGERAENVCGVIGLKAKWPVAYVAGKRGKPIKPTLGNFLVPAFVAAYPSYAHKSNLRMLCLRFINLCASDKKSSHKIRYKEALGVHGKARRERWYIALRI